MDARQQILSKIENYLATTGMSASRFGLQISNSHKLVPRLRAGEGITLMTVEKIEAFIRRNPSAKSKPS